MKNKTRKLSITFFLHFFLLLLTQTKPPESYSLIRGVNENINLNSGTVDLNISLFEINEGHLKLSNTLKYESQGFVPHLAPSYVGLNWQMMQFGKITREGHRIDFSMSGTSLLFPPAGSSGGEMNTILSNPKNYFRNDCIDARFAPINGVKSYKKNIYNNYFDKDYYASLFFPASAGGPGYFSKSYDYDPDKFYFEFMDYKGYFVIDNEGTPIVNCENGVFKVDVSNYGCHDLFGDIAFSQIIMTDDKGNKFYFGGNPDALDINFSFNRVNLTDQQFYIPNLVTTSNKANKVNYIDSWMLNKIELNDGTIVNAHYKHGSMNILNDFRGFNPEINLSNNNSNLWIPYFEDIDFPSRQTLKNNNLVVNHTRQYNDTDSRFGGLLGSQARAFKHVQIDTYTKRAVLDSITTNNLSIAYQYIDSSNPLELSNNYLNKIVLKRKNKLVKQVDLVYENLGLSNKRTFLKKVANSLNEDVNFEYYNTDNFPPYKNSYYFTNELGYWNGMMDPEPNFDQYVDYSFPDNLSKYDVGLLRKVIYPTRGNTTYLYQNGDYSKIYKYNDFNNPEYLVLADENKTVNVPRVYKKIENDLKGAFVETLYEYKNDNGSSSGIIDGVLFYIPTSYNGGHLTKKNTSANLLSQNSLHYSTVKENIQNKGYTKFRFTDRITNPDILNAKINKNPSDPARCPTEWYSRDNILMSKQYERGKVLKEEIFNNADIKLKEVSYEYNNFLNKLPNIDILDGCTNCKISDLNYYVKVMNVSNGAVPCYGQRIYTPVLPYVQSSQTIKEYFGNKIIESKEDLFYNDSDKLWHNSPIKSVKNNNGNIQISTNLYPSDLIRASGCTDPGCNFINSDNPGKKMLTYKNMVDNNIHLPVVKIDKNNFGKFNLSENIYSQFGTSNKFRLDSQRSSEINSLFDETTFENAVMYEVIKNDIFDNKENIIQSTPKFGIPTTTIWGYDQSLPIAKIEGATYKQVMEAFNLDPTNPNSYLELEIVKKSNLENLVALEGELDNFRNNQNLQDFKITTYTHAPLIGVKSITPNSGLAEKYVYDNTNKLERILNVDNNIIKEYKYHYAPRKFYNSQYTKVFYKNDCPSWMVAQPYTYIVPENKYMSIIDQEDADQMAKNDANANGQAAANAGFNCGFISCDFTPNYYVNVNFSSIQQTASNHISMILTYNANPPSGMSYTGGGVSVGYIGANCRPSSIKYINSGNWRVTITTDGYVIVSALSGAPLPTQTVGFSVEYDK